MRDFCLTFVLFCRQGKMLCRNLINFIVIENKFAEVRTAVRNCLRLFNHIGIYQSLTVKISNHDHKINSFALSFLEMVATKEKDLINQYIVSNLNNSNKKVVNKDEKWIFFTGKVPIWGISEASVADASTLRAIMPRNNDRKRTNVELRNGRQQQRDRYSRQRYAYR